MQNSASQMWSRAGEEKAWCSPPFADLIVGAHFCLSEDHCNAYLNEIAFQRNIIYLQQFQLNKNYADGVLAQFSCWQFSNRHQPKVSTFCIQSNLLQSLTTFHTSSMLASMIQEVRGRQKHSSESMIAQSGKVQPISLHGATEWYIPARGRTIYAFLVCHSFDGVLYRRQLWGWSWSLFWWGEAANTVSRVCTLLSLSWMNYVFDLYGKSMTQFGMMSYRHSVRLEHNNLCNMAGG